MSDIIDFNSRRKKAAAEPEPDYAYGVNEIIEKIEDRFAHLPRTEIMLQVMDETRAVFDKTTIAAMLAGHAGKAAKNAGLNPDDFMIDQRSMGIFLLSELPGEDEQDSLLFNGPAFTDIADNSGYIHRIATTLFEKSDGIAFAVDLFRIRENDRTWEHFNGRTWDSPGLPGEYFRNALNLRLKEWSENTPFPDADGPDEDDDDFDSGDVFLDELDLPPAAVQAFEEEGIFSLYDIMDYSERELLRIRGIGVKTIERIKIILEEYGMELPEE